MHAANRIPGVLLLCASVISAPGCSERAAPAGNGPDGARDHAGGEWYSRRRDLYYGIPVTVRFVPADEGLAAKAWGYLERVDDVFNDYRDDSEIGRLNAAMSVDRQAGARERVSVSDDLAEALRLSREVHRLTGGTFDVTVGAVRRLWQRAEKTGVRPGDADLVEARASCGLDKVTLDGNTLTVGPGGVKFDLGGIVKGIAVDRTIAILKAGGARAGLVQVGGETGAWGMSERGKPHVIGVQHPLHPFDQTRLWTAVADPGTGISAATSGNYRQPVVVGGEVFYHIFDPRTGRPVDTRTFSVSVVFPETGKNGLADGLTTAGAVLGWEKAIPIIEKLGGEALFLVRAEDGIREHTSAGWDGLVAGEH